MRGIDYERRATEEEANGRYTVASLVDGLNYSIGKDTKYAKPNVKIMCGKTELILTGKQAIAMLSELKDIITDYQSISGNLFGRDKLRKAKQ